MPFTGLLCLGIFHVLVSIRWNMGRGFAFLDSLLAGKTLDHVLLRIICMICISIARRSINLVIMYLLWYILYNVLFSEDD